MHPLPDLVPEQLMVANLGEATFRSPLPLSIASGDDVGVFVSDQIRLMYEPRFVPGEPPGKLAFELAGPRQ